MSDILTKARELGEAIAESEEFKALKEAEERQQNDAEATALMNKYNKERKALSDEIMKGSVSEERMAQIRQSLEEGHEAVLSNKVIAQYSEAQKRFDAIVTQMNAILTYYLTGEVSASCGGNCGSCHGCH